MLHLKSETPYGALSKLLRGNIMITFQEDFIYEEYELCSVSGKRCYSEREAGRIVNSCHRHRSNDHLGRNKNLPRRKYFCTDCGTWHLTHLAKYDKDSYGAAREARFYMEYERVKKAKRVA